MLKVNTFEQVRMRNESYRKIKSKALIEASSIRAIGNLASWRMLFIHLLAYWRELAGTS